MFGGIILGVNLPATETAAFISGVFFLTDLDGNIGLLDFLGYLLSGLNIDFFQEQGNTGHLFLSFSSPIVTLLSCIS